MVTWKHLIAVFAGVGLVMQVTVRTQETTPKASAAPR